MIPPYQTPQEQATAIAVSLSAEMRMALRDFIAHVHMSALGVSDAVQHGEHTAAVLLLESHKTRLLLLVDAIDRLS